MIRAILGVILLADVVLMGAVWSSTVRRTFSPAELNRLVMLDEASTGRTTLRLERFRIEATR